MNVRLPATLRVPIELPGASTPPLTKTLSIVPVPPSVPPALTVTKPLMVPLTESVPPSTFQACAPVPVTVQFELSILLKVVKPSYCWPAPIRLRLKVSLPVPPSWNVSMPVPSTRPLMTLPGPSVSTLAMPQPPQNSIAAEPVAALIVPELKTVPVPLTRIPVAPAPTLIVPVLMMELLPPKPVTSMPTAKPAPTVMVPLLVIVLESPSTTMPTASSPRRIRPLLLIVPDEPL